ncbi:uncharacterized protein LOC143152088 isoform X1 [Ptiloglossa arizonensis]|uniref:uncharacterized protein LOC143152088 isoform X1 n=2 Tax=Ptiloglossa arizonensis TaxID=3350558 RepID=UPI003F9F0081
MLTIKVICFWITRRSVLLSRWTATMVTRMKLNSSLTSNLRIRLMHDRFIVSEPRGNRDKTQRYSKYIVRGFDVTSFARGNTESRDDEHARGERRPASELEGELDDESSMKPRSDGEATESRGTTNRSASRRDTRATKTSRYDAREKLTTPCDA